MDLDHVGELIGLNEQAISAVERKLLVLEVPIPALRQTSRAGAGKPIFTLYSSSDGDIRSAMLGSFSAPIQISGHLANFSHNMGGS